MTAYDVEINGRTVRVESVRRHNSRLSFKVGEKLYEIDIAAVPKTAAAAAAPIAPAEVAVKPPAIASSPSRLCSQPDAVVAPMPGIVTNILVREGQAVALHQPVVVIEAMKMENNIIAHRAGTIKAIHVQVGLEVENAQVLVSFE